jgi:hypothetical protein
MAAVTQLFTSTHPLPEDMDGAPYPPPAEVKDLIPAFHFHGERRCGDHAHDLSAAHFTHYLARHGKDASSAWTLSCSNCHARSTLNQLHDLPCGDLICRDCLLVKALGVKLSIERNCDKIHDARVQMTDLSKSYWGLVDPREKRMSLRRHAQLKRSVLRLAGFTCCGVNMRLERFLPCMSAAVSRELWLAIRWVSDDVRTHRACAWPDCGAFAPSCCTYVVPGECARRWYCVMCQGNSMDCARQVDVAQMRFPFLPRGQPALTPCM